MKKVEFEADKLNLVKMTEGAQGLLKVTDPLSKKSLRKRGRYRAAKRGEFWAITELAMIKMIKDFVKAFYE